MASVVDWILEAHRLLREAQQDDIRNMETHLHSDIWHERVKNLIDPVEIHKVKE